MSVSELSASTQNYLKVVWSLSEWSDMPVTPSHIAAKMGLKLSSVSDAVRKLSTQGLLIHAPYGSVELSERGNVYALSMVRRHRLIESFLVTALGFGWDQVHDEAESLEHAVSDFMIDRIDVFLGFPTRDPHGDPIPSASGTMIALNAEPLSTIGDGVEVIVERISDADPTLLQFFEEHGVVVGARLTVSVGAPFSDAINVIARGSKREVALGRSAANAVYVSNQ
jgi:DtxR family Mn-dependent transcriptional regulator